MEPNVEQCDRLTPSSVPPGKERGAADEAKVGFTPAERPAKNQPHRAPLCRPNLPEKLADLRRVYLDEC